MQELIYRTYAVTLFCVTKPCFACGSMVRSDRFVCGVSARSAEKPHTKRSESTILPQAKHGFVTQKSATA